MQLQRRRSSVQMSVDSRVQLLLPPSIVRYMSIWLNYKGKSPPSWQAAQVDELVSFIQMYLAYVYFVFGRSTIYIGTCFCQSVLVPDIVICISPELYDFICLYCQCQNYRTEVEEYEGTVIYRTLLFYNSVFLGRYEKKSYLNLLLTFFVVL